MPEEKKLSKSTVGKLNRSKPMGIKASLHKQDPESVAEKIEMARIASSQKSMKRVANDMSFSGTGGVDRVPLLYMDPLFDPVIMLFPKDNVRELNRRLRHYYQYNPYIRNIIDLHSSLPLSDFDFKCQDPAIEKYFNDFKQRKDLLNSLVMLGIDHWLLGEGMMYGNWDNYEKEFSTFNQYAPEDIEVKNTYSNEFVYLMKPNETIKKQLRSADPIDQKLNDMLETSMPEFTQKMASGQPYIFDNKRFMHLARRPNKYTPRGISPVLSVIKDLMYEDKLRMLLMTFVDRHVFPIKIFKIGSEAKGWVPPPSKMKEFEQLLLQASNDPDFNIVTHPFVQVDYVTGNDKIMDLIPHFDFVAKRYMVGLFVNDAVVHGELGPYAAQAVSVKILMNKYMSFREMVSNMVTEKICTLLAVQRGFVKRKQADLAHNVRTTTSGYDIPKIFWNRMNLTNSRDLMDMVTRLRENGEVPFKYVAELFDWDVEGIKNGFKEEEATPLDKLWRDIRVKKTEDPAIANQVLDGVKTKDLKIVPQKQEGDALEGGKSLGEPSSLSDMKSDILGGPIGGGGGGAPLPEAPAAPLPESANPEAVPGAAPLDNINPESKPAGGGGVAGLEEAIGGPTETKLPTEQGGGEPPAI